MCGSPKPPDPVKTAEAQYTYNTKAAQDAAKMNAIDQHSAYGSTTFQRDANGVPISQDITLSPEVQKWLDSQFASSSALQDATKTQLGYLPTDKYQLPTGNARDTATQNFGAELLDPSKFSDTGQIAQTSYDQAKSLFQPDIEAAQKAKGIELARRGIPVGSEIYNDEMNRLDRSANNAYAGASRQATLDAGNEQTRRVNTAIGALGYGNNAFQTNLSNDLMERNQPFAEAGALMGTTPTFQQPSFMNTTAQSIAAPDYQGAVKSNYEQQSAMNQAMWNTAGKLGSSAMMMSDEELKENRQPADGEGILAMFRDMPVDDYDYKDEAKEAYGLPESRTGPMAQDYERAAPEGSDGHMIDLGDAVGKLMAAVKALDKRTQAYA